MQPSDITPLLGITARLRRTLRTRYALRAVGLCGAVAVGALLICFLMDWGLELPGAFRRVLLGLSTLLLAFVAWTRGLWPLIRPLSDQHLAVWIEEAQPGLQGLFVTAVELGGRATVPDGSSELVAEVVRRAVAQPPRPSGGPRVRLWPALASAAWLALVALGAWSQRPDLGRVFLQRFFAGRDLPWPREVALRLLHHPGPRVVVVKGEDLPLEVEVERGRPDRVELVLDFPHRALHERVPMVGHGERLFRRVVENLTEPFRFHVVGGDGRTGEFQVELRTRPAVRQLALELSFPAYTGRSAERQSGGDCTLPVGTQVTVLVDTVESVTQGEIVLTFGGGGGAEVATRRLPLEARGVEGADGRAWSGRFEIERDGHFHVDLRNADGLSNAPITRYTLRAVADRAPVVQIREPGRDRSVTVEAVYPLVASAQDEYGLVEARLVVQRLGLEEPAEAEPPEGALSQVALKGLIPGVKEAALTGELDVASLGAKVGDRLVYHAQAVDACPQPGPNLGRSARYTFHVVSPADLARRIDQALLKAKDRLGESARLQETVRGEVQRLREQLEAQGQSPSSAITDKAAQGEAQRAEAQQQRVARELESAAAELEEVVTQRQINRLGAEAENAWLQEGSQKLRETAGGPAEAARKAIAEARGRAQALQRLAEAAKLQTRTLEDLRGLLAELDRWSDVNEILRDLSELIKFEREVQGAVRKTGEGKGEEK